MRSPERNSAYPSLIDPQQAHARYAFGDMDQPINGTPNAQWISTMAQNQCDWSVDISENRDDNFCVLRQPMVMQGKNRRSLGASGAVDALHLVFDLPPKDLGICARVNPASGREYPPSPRNTLLFEPGVDSW
jgi:hypothetical protein